MSLVDFKEQGVSVPLHDLVVMLWYYHVACEQKQKVGECDYDKGFWDTIRDIQLRSTIEISKVELENLCYHYKQCVLEKVNAKDSMVPTYDEYVKITRRISDCNKGLMTQNKETGEWEFPK